MLTDMPYTPPIARSEQERYAMALAEKGVCVIHRVTKMDVTTTVERTHDRQQTSIQARVSCAHCAAGNEYNRRADPFATTRAWFTDDSNAFANTWQSVELRASILATRAAIARNLRLVRRMAQEQE